MGKRDKDGTTGQAPEHEAPAEDSKVSHGSLREAVNSGEYGIKDTFCGTMITTRPARKSNSRMLTSAYACRSAV